MKKTVLLLFGLIFTTIISAQSYNINLSGFILDKETNESLVSVNVMFGNGIGTITNLEGYYSVDVPANTPLKMTVSLVGFEEFYQSIPPSSLDVFMDTIYLSEGILLEEVEIKEKLPIAVAKGDTIAFNADAYKVNQNAKGVNLVKKLPGFKVEENKIETQGEEVQKIYVDGKPFFENDPKNALNTLPAEIIESIEVFDDYGEVASFTGYASGNSVKAINIITDKNKRKLVGNIEAGYGSGGTYLLDGSLLFSKKKHNLTLIVESNNQNQSRINLEPITSLEGLIFSKAGLSSGNGSSIEGVQHISNIGLNYSYEIGDKSNLNLDYIFSKRSNKIDETRIKDYQDAWRYNTQSNTNINSDVHQFNLSYDVETDKSKFILKESLVAGNSSSKVNSNIIGMSDNVTYTGIFNSNSSKQIKINNQTTAIYLHNFNDEGRSITALGNLNIRHGENNMRIDQSTEYYINDFTISDDSFIVNDDLSSNENKLTTRITYKEPVGFLKSLNLVLSSNVSWSNSDIFRSDMVSLNPEDFSEQYRSQSYANKVEFGFSSFGINLIFNAGLGLESLVYDKRNNEQAIDRQHDLNLYPLVFGKYFFSSRSNMMFLIRGSSFTPSAKQLHPVVNYYDPLQLSIGNPDLVPGSQNLFVVKYNNALTKRSQYISGYLFGKITEDFIGISSEFLNQDTVYYGQSLSKGTNVVMPINLNTAYNIIGGVDYTFPINLILSNVTVGLKYSYSNLPTKFNNEQLRSQLNSGSLNISISSNISEDIDFILSNESGYNYGSNTINSSHSEYFNNSLDADIYYMFYRWLYCQTEIKYSYFNYFDKADSDHVIVANIGLGANLLKDKVGVKLMFHDVFDQNNNQQFEMHESYTTLRQTNSIGRYIQLSASYKF